MEEARIRKVMMDISIPEMTGGPRATGVEECECPDGYSGLSCEICDDGFHRDESNACISEHTQPYSPYPTPQSYPPPLEYPDPRDYDEDSHSEPIEVKISGPKVQTVQPGETVEFDCRARPRFRTQV